MGWFLVVFYTQPIQFRKDVQLNTSPVQQMQPKKRTKLTCPHAFFHTHGHFTGSNNKTDLEPLRCACLNKMPDLDSGD